MAATVAGYTRPGASSVDMDKVIAKSGPSKVPHVKRNQLITDSLFGGSQINQSLHSDGGSRRNANSIGRDSMQRINQMRERQQKTQQRRAEANEYDGDFEKMFGRDIDKYLEESDFDVEEYEKLS